MSFYKSVYGVNASKIIHGNTEDLLKIAKTGCDLKVATIDATRPTGTFQLCDQVAWYENSTHPAESNVGCGYFENMATNATTLPEFTFFKSSMYHYYVWFNSNGTTVASRWDLNGTKVGPSSDQYHTEWYAEPDCVAFALQGEESGLSNDTMA